MLWNALKCFRKLHSCRYTQVALNSKVIFVMLLEWKEIFDFGSEDSLVHYFMHHGIALTFKNSLSVVK